MRYTQPPCGFPGGYIAFFHAEYKDRMKEISIILDRYIPDTTQMRTELKKNKSAFIKPSLRIKNSGQKMKSSPARWIRHGSIFKKMQHFQLKRDLKETCALIECIPPEVIKEYTESIAKGKAIPEHEVS